MSAAQARVSAAGPTARGLPGDQAGWSVDFGRFDDIVLVANSDAVDIAALERRFGEGTLFVFFNKVYKVLDRPFERPALLVARSSPSGANVVYRREVGALLGLFRPSVFRGFLNLKAAPSESFSDPGGFEGAPVGYLDLSASFDGFYSADHVPSSGFALAVWLAEQPSAVRIHLAGFTGQRGERWKIFRVHDWTFEQTVQRLLLGAGRLSDASEAGPGPADPLQRIAARFPDIARQDVLAAASTVLAVRLDQADATIDELLIATRPQRRLRALLLRLKPKTRKQRDAKVRAAAAASAPEGGRGE